MLSQNRGEMISRSFWFWILNISAFVFSHESRQHGDYSFKHLREAVNGDYLTPEEQQTLFNSLHLLNCTELERRNELDYRKCFTTSDLHEFEGSWASRGLNSTEFADISPVIIYCLLPSSQKNPDGEKCNISHKSHEQLFKAFVSNYSESQEGISYKGLETILEQINNTVGQFFTKKKCFSADSIIKEVLKEEENTLDQNEFKKACASIILHLVQGYCIGKSDTLKKLPSKAFFIDDIFMHKSHLSREDFHEIIRSLGIGQTSPESTTHGHHHRRRRSTMAGLLPKKELVSSHAVYRREIDHHGNQVDAHQSSGTCYSLDDLLTIFDVDHLTGADRDDFQSLCPAFIQQAKSGACSSGQSHRKPATVTERDTAKIWGYGIGAVTLISLTSLAGVATIPFIGKRLYNKVLDLLVGLAVGSLAGDGLLHLLPHSFGLHAHEEEGSTGDSHDHSEEHAFIWKAMVVLASIYVFYLFEILTHLGLKSKFLGLSSHESKLEEQLRKGKNEIPKDNKDIVLMNVNSKDVQDVVQSDKGDHENERVGASLQPRSSASSKKKSWRNISAVAWMIIIGDSLHNISDGLAIGAVFSEGGPSGISGGISTSIAVFCHELPHELGDFAVLLKAGMSVKMALLANFLSALSCFIGLFIGIEVGQQGEVRLWFFAIAGGIFLYVALVDMLPHLIHSKTLKAEPLVTFLLQNVGLLIGFGILLIIALYEENLKGLKF
ncbi:metal cation symporter ZIP14-like [Acropora muricata]|uniref:metal cation symporter ZIP14-like n=1 Tax=Acropora muricata TaxID=159855 RepID=UPI0034E40FAB